jgi:hypothetical protein
MDEGTGKQSASNGALTEFVESNRVRPKRENTLFRIKDSVIFFLCTQAVRAHPFVLARKDGKRAQGGAVNSRREGYLIAPPCTSWHLPSSYRVPISKDIFMDEGTGKRSASNGALEEFEESNRVRPKRGIKSYDFCFAIGVAAEGAKGAVRPLTGGAPNRSPLHLLAPPIKQPGTD